MTSTLDTSVGRPQHAHPECPAHRQRAVVGRRVGIVLPNWVGDVVMATPALRALRDHYGSQTELVGIMNPTAADVLAGTSFFDDVVPYQRRSRIPALRLLGAAIELRRRALDTVLLLTNSFSSAWLARLSGARHRIGYARYGRGPLLTTALRPSRSGWRFTPVSAVDYYLDLAYSVGCPTQQRRLELAVPETDHAAADTILRRLKFDVDRPLVTLNNGGAYGGAKKWPTGHLIDLARRLVARTDASVLIVCGPAEQAEAGRIEQAASSDRVRSLAAEAPSIGLTKACIARSRVVVSTDSGVRHFAAAFGAPCVTLFGPSDPRWSHNYHPAERVLRLDLACSPCGRRTCPLQHHRCLQELSASSVLDAVQSFLMLTHVERRSPDDRGPCGPDLRTASERSAA